jgi:hypothetical protein
MHKADLPKLNQPPRSGSFLCIADAGHSLRDVGLFAHVPKGVKLRSGVHLKGGL